MKRNIILTSFLFLTLGSVAHAKSYPTSATYGRRYNNDVLRYKFGPLIGLGGVGASGTAGCFGEYKYAKDKSIQLAVGYFMNEYFLGSLNLRNGGSALVQAHYISIPIILRSYVVEPKNGREAGFSLGVQLGYLFDAKFKFKEEKILHTDKFTFTLVNDFEKIIPVDLQEVAEQAAIRRWQVGIVVGYDLEFKNGFILGTTYTYDFITVIQADQSRSNWSYQSRFGYNLTKLFV